jgi:hypothetical protein
VAELALNDDQRHAFASHFDGVRVQELVRREAPAHTGCYGRPAQVGSRGDARPRPGGRGRGHRRRA